MGKLGDDASFPSGSLGPWRSFSIYAGPVLVALIVEEDDFSTTRNESALLCDYRYRALKVIVLDSPGLDRELEQ